MTTRGRKDNPLTNKDTLSWRGDATCSCWTGLGIRLSGSERRRREASMHHPLEFRSACRRLVEMTLLRLNRTEGSQFQGAVRQALLVLEASFERSAHPSCGAGDFCSEPPRPSPKASPHLQERYRQVGRTVPPSGSRPPWPWPQKRGLQKGFTSRLSLPLLIAELSPRAHVE